jgi:signal transduction histidine kinase
VPDTATRADPASAGFVHRTVAFAWAITLVALVAIGLGVRRLVSLTERRREFTYAVTHELRTPLTTFQLYTDMLAAKLVPEEKRVAYLETLNREAKRLSDLVTEVLEFSRIENDAVHAQMGTHSVRKLVETVRERYELRCHSAGMTLDVDVNGAGERLLYTDPDIALQILGTLIDNACKYASRKERGQDARQAPPLVQLRVQDAGKRMSIEVADNGPGISSKDRKELFKPFRRGSPDAVARTGGVGLGLALAKRWTRLIRGQLELVDRPARSGACFRLTLPTPTT